MVLVPSTMLPLGTPAPAFSLPEPSGKIVSLHDFAEAPALLVAFLSNHCPYVKHIRHAFAAFVREYQARGLAVVGINSNDIVKYPADSPEMMAKEIEEIGYTFPYLFDESQAVAKAYRAACTPEFYLFDRAHKLVYRGQMDDSRPGSDKPINAADLRQAVDALFANQPIPQEQKPSVGCNIKWKEGNAPDYF